MQEQIRNGSRTIRSHLRWNVHSHQHNAKQRNNKKNNIDNYSRTEPGNDGALYQKDNLLIAWLFSEQGCDIVRTHSFRESIICGNCIVSDQATTIPHDPLLRLSRCDIFHAKDSRNETSKNIKFGNSHKTPCFLGDPKGFSWQTQKTISAYDSLSV